MPRHFSIQSAAPLAAKPRLLASSATPRSLPRFTKEIEVAYDLIQCAS